MAINAIARIVIDNADNPTAMIEALTERETAAVGQILVAASNEGLMPAVVALALVEAGLGADMVPGAREVIQREAEAQRAHMAEHIEQINALIRRAQEGGG